MHHMQLWPDIACSCEAVLYQQGQRYTRYRQAQCMGVWVLKSGRDSVIPEINRHSVWGVNIEAREGQCLCKLAEVFNSISLGFPQKENPHFCWCFCHWAFVTSICNARDTVLSRLRTPYIGCVAVKTQDIKKGAHKQEESIHCWARINAAGRSLFKPVWRYQLWQTLKSGHLDSPLFSTHWQL